MNKPGRIFKPTKLVVPYLKSQQEEKPDTPSSDDTTTTTTKPETSSSAPTTKKTETSTQNICSSKSISDRREETEPQLQRDLVEASKAVKAGCSASSSSSSSTKEGTSSSTSSSEKQPTGFWGPMTPEDEREWKRIVHSLSF